MTRSELFLCLAAVFSSACSRSGSGPAVGAAAPDFQASDLAGKRVYLNACLGRPVVLFFYATWCGPCQEELSRMVEISNDFGGRVNVIGVLVDPENIDRVRSLAAALGVDYPILADDSGRIAAAYGVITLPRSFLLDRRGRIRSSPAGWERSLDESIREQLKFMLAEE